MKFKDWFNEDDHDTYNFPNEAMEAAWDAATAQLQARVSKPFPVLNCPDGCPGFVKWDALNEGHARHIHGQTLKRLAERGGLGPTEIVWNLGGMRWGAQVDKDYAVSVVRKIEYTGGEG